MFDLHKYFRDSMNPDEFYDLRFDGRLYKFIFINSSWEDVTYSQTLDSSWIELTHNECYNQILKIYIECSVYNLRNHPEYFEEGSIPATISKNYTFYATFRCVYARDKRENTFICTPGGLLPCPELDGEDSSFLDTIPTYNVMEHLVRIDSLPISIFDLDLYVDKDQNVVGMEKNTKQAFILSRYTKNLDKLNDYQMGSWKSIEYSDIEKIYSEGFEEEYTLESLKENRVAQDILYGYKKNTEKENNEKYGMEFIYFRDLYGVVYARDENGEEYRLDQDGLVKINKIIEKLPLVYGIEPKDVMPSIVMHLEHRIDLGKKKKLNASEVICYSNEDDEIWGKTEDGKTWYFNQDTGEFESIPKKDWPKGLYLMEDVQDNVIFQAELRTGYKIKQYALKYGNGKVDNLYDFYVDEGEKGLKAVYGMDFDGNEYSLTSTSITPVKKGTVKKLRQISEDSLFVALDDLDYKE